MRSKACALPKSGENVGGTFYFSARDDVFGAEPWIIRKPR